MTKTSIYILHGWSYSLHKWEPLVSILKNKNLDPILLKIPGLTEKIDRPWNMNDYINWLDKKLERDLAAAGQEKVILLGHSNGGRIAMAYSMKYPNKVARLVLIDSAGIYHNELYIKYKRRVFGIISRMGRKLAKARLAKNILYSLIGERDYKEASQDLKKTMINFLEFEKTLRPEKISVPTIIIWGRKDGVTPVSDAKVLNSKIVNSKLYIVNNARHSPQFTHPQKVADIISKNI